MTHPNLRTPPSNAAPASGAPVCARLRVGRFATLFSEGVEEAAPRTPPAAGSGVLAAASALLTESLRTLFAPSPAPRPIPVRIQVRRAPRG